MEWLRLRNVGTHHLDERRDFPDLFEKEFDQDILSPSYDIGQNEWTSSIEHEISPENAEKNDGKAIHRTIVEINLVFSRMSLKKAKVSICSLRGIM
jgi:hypothetical protein